MNVTPSVIALPSTPQHSKRLNIHMQFLLVCKKIDRTLYCLSLDCLTLPLAGLTNLNHETIILTIFLRRQ